MPASDAVFTARRSRGVAADRVPPDPRHMAAATRLHAMFYDSLVRLAALLTGDERIAAEVACDALVGLCRSSAAAEPDDRALWHLRRQVVTRSRLLRRHYGRSACAGTDNADRFGGLPAVRALQGLRTRELEAVVLTLYLDLTETDAAAMAGTSRAVLQQNLAAGMTTMRALLGGHA